MPVNGKLSGQELQDLINFQSELRKGHWVWKKTLSLVPRKCKLSGVIINPFSYAYKGKQRNNWPAKSEFLLRVDWLHKDAFLIMKIKGVEYDPTL